MDNSGEAVLYGSDESRESTAMVDLLNELGVQFEYRSVNHDPAALREGEQLDGERVPLLRMGHNSIVRGFDRIKVQQLCGGGGCWPASLRPRSTIETEFEPSVVLPQASD